MGKHLKAGRFSAARVLSSDARASGGQRSQLVAYFVLRLSAMMPGARLMYQSVFLSVFCFKHMDCTSALCGFRRRVSLKIPTASRDAGLPLIASLC